MKEKSPHRVLVVDDEEPIVEMLKYNLQQRGYAVRIAFNGEMALDIVKYFRPELILLDVMMPGIDGIETCRRLRAAPGQRDTHVVFLTARAEDSAEIAAFEAGANEYIQKPVKPRVLMSRVDALFRREHADSDQKIKIGDLLIDRAGYIVWVGDREIALPRKEFELLAFLGQNPNKVFSRDELLKNIWGADVYVLSRTVDVHIRKIREKIGGNYISTIKGVGYKFNPL